MRICDVATVTELELELSVSVSYCTDRSKQRAYGKLTVRVRTIAIELSRIGRRSVQCHVLYDVESVDHLVSSTSTIVQLYRTVRPYRQTPLSDCTRPCTV